MKRFILLLLVTYSIDLIAQNYTGKETVLPNYTASSPEAASLGQYGNVPINLAIGQINYTIPLHTIKVGDFEYPLTLSYGYLGFKPDSDPSMVGMGWTANFGGAIVQQVKGGPDNANGGYQSNSWYLDKLNNFDNVTESGKVSVLKNVVDQGLDLRPDVYCINTPTLNGSFRLKLDKSCVFAEHRNYNITAGSDFDLIDDKGILYKFTEKEISSTISLNSSQSSDVTHPNAWMISRIELPNAKGNLTFSYKPPVTFQTQNATFSFIHKTPIPMPGQNLSGGDMDIYSASATCINSQIIRRIDFPGGYVVFGTSIENITVSGSSIGWSYNYPTNQVKLQHLSVYDSHDKLITKYVFDYYDQGYYYFLKSIKKEDEHGNKEEYYSFDYYDLDQVPGNKITSDKVDMLGFYNERSFNKNDISYSLNGSFAHSRIGALKQITYPTKGTTEIEYEDHGIVKYDNYFKNLTPELDASVSLYDAVSEPDHADYTAVTQELVIPYSQQVNVSLEIFSSYSGSFQCCGLKNSSGSYVPLVGIGSGVVICADPDNGVQRKTLSCALEKGTYYLYSLLEKVGVEDSYSRVTVEYSNKTNTEGGTQTFTTSIGGIRIAKTIDNPGNGQEPITRNYKYDAGELSISYPRFRSMEITRITSNDTYYQLDSIGRILVGGTIILEGDEEKYLEYTETFRPILPFSSVGSYIQYGQVEIENNDGTNGKKIYEFTDVVGTTGPDNPLFPDQVSEFERRQFELTGEKIYRYSENGPKREHYYNYQENIYPENHVEDYEIIRYPVIKTYSFQGTNSQSESTVNSFKIGSVEHHTRAYRNNYTTESIHEGNGTINTRTNYTYDPQTGYPIEVSTTNSDGKIIKNKTYYPKNSGQLSGLNQSVINTMIAQNILANPIQTEKVIEVGGTLLSKTTQRTAFKDWGTNPDNTHRILPEYIQTSIGTNPLESRIRYHDYYPNGNGKEVSKTDDISIYYIWGYQEQYPIAMIENFTTAQANAVQSNLINPAVAASNSDNDRTIGADGKEGALRTALNSIRNNEALKDAMVTTYTYDPLIGITSVTDPRGVTTYYSYDTSNHLLNIKNDDDNVLNEYKYHYSNQ